MVIKLSETEMTRLSSDISARRTNIAHIRQALHVAAADRGWSSKGADSFRAAAAEHEAALAQLERTLTEWQQICNKHARFAHALNAPFK